MRHRKATHILTASVLFLLLTIFVWIAAYIIRFDIGYSWRSEQGIHSNAIAFFNGEIFYMSSDIPSSRTTGTEKTGLTAGFSHNRDPSFVIRWSHAGFFAFSARTYEAADSPTWTQAGVPFWFVVLLCLPLVGWQYWLLRRRRRAMSKEFCARCGYDLRASSLKCPECGQAIPQIA